MAKGPEHLKFKDAAAWRAWLDEHHAMATEAHVLLTKGKTAGLKKPQALAEALAYGWIDGVGRPVDADWFCLSYQFQQLAGLLPAGTCG